MKLPTLALVALAALTAVEARTTKTACSNVCPKFLSSFKTKSNCTTTDYGCMCVDDIYVDSYAMCINECVANEQASTWKSFSKSCKKGGAPLDGSYKDYLAEGLSNYVSSDDITKKTVVTVPVKPGKIIINNLAARWEKNYNMKWAEYFGNIINAFWGFLLIISFGRLLTLRLYPKRGSAPNRLVTKVRKLFTIPSAFGGKHIEAVKIGKVSVGSVMLRWQFVALFVLFVLNMVFLFVKMWTTDTPNTSYYTKAIQRARNVGDRSAIMTLTLLPVLFMFGGRNNILMYYTGWSFDTFNVFHKWLGRIVFMDFCIHAWAFTYLYRNTGKYNGEGAGEYWAEEILHTPENYYGIVAIVMLGLIFIGSVYIVRHNFYETFLALHVALAAVFVGVGWHHVLSHGYMEYFYAVVAIWGFDIVIRAFRIIAANPFNTAQLTVHGEATYLTVKPAHGWKAKPGQYAFIYVLRHNFWESHPFSIVETRDGHYVFVAKAHSGMTKKLHKSTTKASGSDTVRVWIEGPYGESFPVTRYETVLLVAGGIGITAITSYALDMKRKQTDQHVILYWMVRNQVSLRWVKDQLAELSESGLIEIHIFVTGEEDSVDEKVSESEESPSGSSTDLSTEKAVGGSGKYDVVYKQRPDMASVIAGTIKTAAGSVAVVSCGPGSLADTCRAAVAENLDQAKGRVDYFEDAFSWA